MSDVPQLYLASASPRRAELLRQVGLCFEQVSAPVDETPYHGESPADYVQRLALAKARAGHAVLAGKIEMPVLGADTIVVLDGKMLGKPVDRAHGMAMLERLSNREHQVFSGVAVMNSEQEHVALQISNVQFRALSAAEREAYWESGEPADKAGAYGIQGLGASFIMELRGSHSGVMGLPLYESAELLKKFGIQILAAKAPK